jgi:hypothetical protein
VVLPEEINKASSQQLILAIIDEVKLSRKLWKSLFVLRQLDKKVYEELKCQDLEAQLLKFLNDKELLRRLHHREAMAESLDAPLYFGPDKGPEDFYAWDEEAEVAVVKIQDWLTTQLAEIYKTLTGEVFDL